MSAVKPSLPLGAAHAPSPDARCAHPGLRSLDADCASPSMAALVSNAGSRGTGSPELPLSSGTGFRSMQRATERGTVRASEPGYGSKRSQDGEAQRTCSERMPRRHPRTSGDEAWAVPSATMEGSARWIRHFAHYAACTSHGWSCRREMVLPGEDRRSDPGLSRALAMEGSARWIRHFAWSYQAKCAKALFASAMRCTLSRFVTAAPSRL